MSAGLGRSRDCDDDVGVRDDGEDGDADANNVDNIDDDVNNNGDIGNKSNEVGCDDNFGKIDFDKLDKFFDGNDNSGNDDENGAIDDTGIEIVAGKS